MCLAGGGYPTQPASVPPLPPLPTARHNTATAHLLPSPGSPLGDSFQLSELNGDMFFPCPGFIVWLSPTPLPSGAPHHPVRPWAPSQSQGCCSPACPLVAHRSAAGLGGQEELAKNQNISPELGFELDPDAWTHGTTSGRAPVPSRTVHMPQSGQAQPPLGTTAAQRSHWCCASEADEPRVATAQAEAASSLTAAPGRIGANRRFASALLHPFCLLSPSPSCPPHPCPVPYNVSSAMMGCSHPSAGLSEVVPRVGPLVSLSLEGREQSGRRDFGDASVPPPSSAFCSEASGRTPRAPMGAETGRDGNAGSGVGVELCP